MTLYFKYYNYEFAQYDAYNDLWEKRDELRGEKLDENIEQNIIGENKIKNINLNKPYFLASHIFIDFETDNKLNTYMNPFLVSITAVIVV